MGTRYIIMPLRGPNLQVRTCKIQAKLDSKLDPSVAIVEIIPFLKNNNQSQTKPNQTVQNTWDCLIFVRRGSMQNFRTL